MKHRARQLISTPAMQPFWLRLQKLCHAGMNYGGGQSVHSSGEMHALQFAARALRCPNPLVLFDVGANAGEYLGAALSTLGAGVRAFSFEPQSSSFEALNAHFGNDPRVSCRKLALGKEHKEADLFFNSSAQTTASLRRRSFDDAVAVEAETVAVTTLDRFCEQEEIKHIDFLKIDTEGHEMEVLLGAQRLLKSDAVSCVQFEFGEAFVQSGYYFRDAHDLLRGTHKIYRVLRRGLVEVPRYSTDLEIFKCANFLCVHKKQASRSRAR